MEYVVGFLFDESLRRVILIKKKRPEAQKGRFNGVGGKIEAGESPAEAMRREFLEEGGVDVQTWVRTARLCGADYMIHVFAAISDPLFHRATAQTDESLKKAGLFDIFLSLPMVEHSRWMLAMCIEFMQTHNFAEVETR